ncbi:MAG: RNA methyltransferase [Candidatus Diapherotrites archaeon]|nr:RNA methyltransferase [Candidatus Diapherotrites archaeon]
MNAKIVLVRPLYEENVGYIARLAANFECKEIALVQPKCDWRTGKAKSRAMHGRHLLLKAKKFNNLQAALRDCAYSIATTAITSSGGSIKRTAISVQQFAERFAGSRRKIALVFGSEQNGLSNAEIAECDFIVSIDAGKKYKTLNIGHAAAIMLYCLFAAKQAKKGTPFPEASNALKKQLGKKFMQTLQCLPGIENRAAVLSSFKALAGRSLLAEKEAMALLAFLNEAQKGIGAKQKD